MLTPCYAGQSTEQDSDVEELRCSSDRDGTLVSCDVLSDKLELKDVIVNRGHCESPVLTDEEFDTIKQHVVAEDGNSLKKSDDTALRIWQQIQQGGREVVGAYLLQKSIMSIQLLNAPTQDTKNRVTVFNEMLKYLLDPSRKLLSTGLPKPYSFGERILFPVDCPNFIEYSIVTDAGTFTAQVHR